MRLAVCVNHAVSPHPCKQRSFNNDAEMDCIQVTVRYALQVDFEQVPDLVATRKVFLLKGTAYVSRGDVASLVVGHFR